MKSKAFVAVALIAMGGISSFWEPAIAAPLAVEQLAQVQEQIYREPTGLFEISLPEGYTYEQTGSGIAFTSPDQRFGGSVDYGSAQGNVLTIAQLEASLKSEYEKRLSDLVWQGSSSQPDGSLRIDWLGRDPQGNALDAVSFIEQRGDTIFILNLFGVNADYQDYNADAEIIVGGYQVSTRSASTGTIPANKAFPVSVLFSRVSSRAPANTLRLSAEPSRAAQCGQLIAVANQAVSTVQGIAQGSNSGSTAAMTGIAEASDRFASEMQALQLTDPQLVGFQNRFVSMYLDTGSATRAIVEAAENENPEAAQSSFDALKTATDRESPLVSDINRYCAS